MLRVTITLVTALMIAIGVVPRVAPSTAVAEDPYWTTPTVPPKCTAAQRSTGNVAGCVITADGGLPEDRGWPMPPFPTATTGGVLPWVDLARGATGPIVAKVQQALVDRGASITVDGQFGAQTEAAVQAFQSTASLPVTGIVGADTAAALQVENTSSGTFPPTGWNWLGWGYNGSPALAEWESKFVRNEQAIGRLRAGQVRAFPEALPLWEGFLAEIQARGYYIGDGGTYVFRCTATTRKDCAGYTRSSLSNHSYGLASDLNTAKNPLKTYSGINGASACKTPMLTDMPQWVVQVAEKWGLYWGGYGWNSGCSSPDQVKATAYRDPMHFEFNGTPQEAIAIAAHNRGGACIEVADDAGAVSTRCLGLTEVPAAGTRTVIDVDAPAGAAAALVNLTTVGATQNGYVTAEACGPASGTRSWSNANVRPGNVIAALAFVPIDANGRFCLYQSTAMHTIVDVQGYFAPADAAPTGSLYTPVKPARITDTRSRLFCTPDSNCLQSTPVPAGNETVHTADTPIVVTATMANLTLVRPTTNAYLTADACASLAPGPQQRSNLNAVAGSIVANLAVVPSASTEQGAQFCTYSPAETQQIVDVQGFFGPAAQGGLGYESITPDRLVDTRQCRTDPTTMVQRCAVMNGAGDVLRLRAPAGAAAVAVSVTSTQATTGGFVTAGSCAALSNGQPDQSNLNAVVGSSVANMAVVPVDADGTFCIYTSSAMHLAVDLMGTFRTGAPLRFLPITPVRVHDSRRAS